MQKLKLVGFSILSGLLMGLSWPATGNLSFLFFIALTPLLYVEYTVSQNPDKLKARHIFYFSYLAFLTFNTFTTWWIWNASEGGGVMAEVLISLFMSITFLWFHGVKKRLGNKRGYFGLVVLWIGFEWVSYNWPFSHPWNTFGNTFADSTYFIQWYEYTGVLGGSLWILLTNILIFEVIRKTFILGENIKQQTKSIIGIVLLIALPSLLSIFMYNSYIEIENPQEIVVIQPNIDPYNDKFGNMTEAEQIDRILSLAKEKVTPNTKYVIAPETALPRGSEESKLEENYGVQSIRKFINKHQGLSFIIGLSSHFVYPKSDKMPSETARYLEQSGEWYDIYNTAMLIDNSDSIQLYHKSKLVLGVEKIPYQWLFTPLAKYAIDLGGAFGSLGEEKEAFNFTKENDKIAPVICYESIYGDYTSTYINKGAEAIFIITNDGWWGDTPGYKQHLSNARLRAIENRRSIARSANTGTSCFINQRGDVIDATKWWEADVIRNNINFNSDKTFYTKNGDLLGRVGAFFGFLLLLWGWTKKFQNKKSINRF